MGVLDAVWFTIMPYIYIFEYQCLIFKYLIELLQSVIILSYYHLLNNTKYKLTIGKVYQDNINIKVQCNEESALGIHDDEHENCDVIQRLKNKLKREICCLKDSCIFTLKTLLKICTQSFLYLYYVSFVGVGRLIFIHLSRYGINT